MSLQFSRARRVLGFGLGVLTLSLAASTAEAHILLADPKPRDNNDAHKNDAMPCPKRTAAQTVTMMDSKGTAYQGGATITVKFNETTNHPGCFGVDISPGGDTGWVMLGTLKHSTMPAKTPRPYETTVTLPAGMNCTDCTLRVRQFMLDKDPAVCPPPTITPGTTYFQCANVVVKAGSGGGMPDGGAAGGSGGGGATGGSGGSTASGGSGGASGGSGGGDTGGSGGSADTGGSGGSVATGGSGGSTATGGKSGGTGGSTPVDTGGEGGDEDTGGKGGGSKRDSGGCNVGGGGPTGGLLLLAALALFSRRRRR
jgi:MYXO-CTERM domain-containing protein